MHEKAQESEECEEVFQAAVKKFRHSQKVRGLLAGVRVSFRPNSSMPSVSRACALVV